MLLVELRDPCSLPCLTGLPLPSPQLTQAEGLAGAAHEYSMQVVAATSTAEVYLAKCLQLEKQLARVDRFEAELRRVTAQLPALEGMVEARIAEHARRAAAAGTAGVAQGAGTAGTVSPRAGPS